MTFILILFKLFQLFSTHLIEWFMTKSYKKSFIIHHDLSAVLHCPAIQFVCWDTTCPALLLPFFSTSPSASSRVFFSSSHPRHRPRLLCHGQPLLGRGGWHSAEEQWRWTSYSYLVKLTLSEWTIYTNFTLPGGAVGGQGDEKSCLFKQKFLTKMQGIFRHNPCSIFGLVCVLGRSKKQKM